MVSKEASVEVPLSRRTLVKITGDALSHVATYEWLKDCSKESKRLVIIVGGGTAISEALEKEDISYQFTEFGRIIDEERGRIIAAKILEKQKENVMEKLQEEGIEAEVIVPVIDLPLGPLHVNGDKWMEALHINFDDVFVLTLNGRVKDFDHLKNVEVIHL